MTSYRKPSKKKGKEATALTKELTKASTKTAIKLSSNITTGEPTLAPSNISNFKDHFTESHWIAFNTHFFGKKICGNEVCKTREECNCIYNVVKNWNNYKELEAEGEMTDNDLKQWRVYHWENHASFEWVKKYSTHILLLLTGEEKPILR